MVKKTPKLFRQSAIWLNLWTASTHFPALMLHYDLYTKFINRTIFVIFSIYYAPHIIVKLCVPRWRWQLTYKFLIVNTYVCIICNIFHALNVNLISNCQSNSRLLFCIVCSHNFIHLLPPTENCTQLRAFFHYSLEHRCVHIRPVIKQTNIQARKFKILCVYKKEVYLGQKLITNQLRILLYF